MNDILNLSNLFSTNPTFPKNDIFADYIYNNPENGNGSLENCLIKDINDERKIIENGKKKLIKIFLINKSNSKKSKNKRNKRNKTFKIENNLLNKIKK